MANTRRAAGEHHEPGPGASSRACRCACRHGAREPGPGRRSSARRSPRAWAVAADDAGGAGATRGRLDPGAQVILDYNGDGSLGARGGIEMARSAENVTARDAHLSLHRVEPRGAVSGPPTGAPWEPPVQTVRHPTWARRPRVRPRGCPASRPGSSRRKTRRAGGTPQGGNGGGEGNPGAPANTAPCLTW